MMGDEAIALARRSLLERPPFATVELGTFPDIEALCAALDAVREPRLWIDQLLRMVIELEQMEGTGAFRLSTKCRTVRLYKAFTWEVENAVGERFGSVFRPRDVCNALVRAGGVRLPYETALLYRLGYQHQPPGQEWQFFCHDELAVVGGPIVCFVAYYKRRRLVGAMHINDAYRLDWRSFEWVYGLPDD